MSDQLLNFFVASGTNAERLAFTPNPAAPASGPDPSYFWLATDTGDSFAWDYAGAAWVQINPAPAAPTESLIVPASDESTPITTGAAKMAFRMPYALTLAGVGGGPKIKASLNTAQVSGSLFTVDVLMGGVSILSTLLTFDNTETTTVTAATPPVVSTSALTADAVMTISVTQVGSGEAAGLKVCFIGHQ